MNTQETHFIKQVSTGVLDSKIKNIEFSLPFFFLLYTKENSFHISFDNNIYLVDKGMAFFIKKSIPFSVLLNWGKQENGLVRKDIVSLKIPQQAINEYMRHYVYKNLSSSKKIASDDYLKLDCSNGNNYNFELLNTLIESFPITSTGDIVYNKVDVAKYILILSLIQQINPGLENMILSSSSLTISEKVASLVMNDYSKNWVSKDLADELNMSVSTFKKKMYHDIGSVSNYITKVKMIEALRQLRRTDLPINAIALSLGYSSPSYFTSVFKKFFNFFPSEIRKYDN